MCLNENFDVTNLTLHYQRLELSGYAWIYLALNKDITQHWCVAPARPQLLSCPAQKLGRRLHCVSLSLSLPPTLQASTLSTLSCRFMIG